MNPRGNVNVRVLEGREGWYKFPKIISSSVAIGVGKFYFLLPRSLSPTKGYSAVWMRSAGRVPCPIGWKGLLPRKSPYRALALAMVSSAPARDFPLLHLKWGLKFLAGPEGRKWLYHSAMHLLMSSGWAGKLWGADRFRYWNQMLPLVHFITMSSFLLPKNNFWGGGRGAGLTKA